MSHVVFLILKDTFVSTGKFCFLSNLHKIMVTFLSILAHSVGNNPFVVYPEVIVASVKSRTALVISETSALVGLGLLSIDSTI